MNDREFDALLESAAPELPPDDVARDVTPWRRAIGNILGGSAMCSITLNFFCLNYLLPTIGVILQLLGFRPLRTVGFAPAGCSPCCARRCSCPASFSTRQSIPTPYTPPPWGRR